jgi:hypothetical protein
MFLQVGVLVLMSRALGNHHLQTNHLDKMIFVNKTLPSNLGLGA